MKKTTKQICLFLLLTAVLLLTGCGSRRIAAQKARSDRTYVYCTDTKGEKLLAVEYQTIHSSFSEVIPEYLSQMRECEKIDGCTSPLPGGVTLRSYTFESGLLTLDFNAVYKQMDDIREAAARSALVLTMTQLPRVERVLITVDGHQLENSRKRVIEAMTRESVLLDWSVISRE